MNALWTASPTTDQIVLFGGEHFDGKQCTFYNDLYVYEIREGEWYKVVTAVGPGPRSAHQGVWGPDGRLYVFGGEFGTSKETRFLHYRDFWALDVQAGKWEPVKVAGQMPPSRSGHRMAVWREVAVMYGGFIDTSGNAIYLDDLWMYHFQTSAWKKVDWLSVHAPSPTARSAFQFCACDDGILLYGGYCQVKGKSGIPKGQVLNDIWLLRMDADQTQIRWDKKKTGSTAPQPRSGCSSTRVASDKMLVFGGVFDEDVDDEYIQGTCSNEMHLYSFRTNKWDPVEYSLAPSGAAESPQICPRFNAMMTTSRAGLAYAFGGIWEIGDVQYTLDDLYVLDPTNPSSPKTLKAISVDLSDWRDRIEAERKEMMASGSDCSGDDSDDSDDSDDESSNDSDESQADIFPGAPADEHAIPAVTKKHRSLKEYFDSSAEYWLARAREANPVAGEKDIRKEAFMLAKTRWDELALLSAVENL